VIRAASSGPLRQALISWFSLSTIATAVPPGAAMPIHDAASYPGRNSATVGRSGNTSDRFAVVTAIPRSLPVPDEFERRGHDVEGDLHAAGKQIGQHGRRAPVRNMQQAAVSLDDVEATVVHGIEIHLACPELVAEYVREFHRALDELRDNTEEGRKQLSKRLGEVEQSIQTIVDLLVKGAPSRALRERLAELESEREAVEAAIAEVAAPPIKLQIDTAEHYREKVRDLRAALGAADEENRSIAHAAIRELIDKVVIRPGEPSRGVEIDIYGRIQSLFPKNEADTESMGVLVAGVRFIQGRTCRPLRKRV
jgi:hypothetical protein